VNNLSEKLPGNPETFSLFGDPLYKIPLDTENLEKQKNLYDEALKEWAADPEDPDKIIWLGRRTAYLGDYREAAGIFSMGIEKHPENAKLYRHRGHRFITLRRFDLAIEDFTKAASLMITKPDETEPNGQPDPKKPPSSTLYFNVWYHLGLAYYLKNDLNNALRAYEDCLTVSKQDDKYVATAHWTYMTLRRLGRTEEADKLLHKVSKDMDIVDNTHYHGCLLMYKGEIDPETLLQEARKEGALGLVTTGYGVANWYYVNGETKKAESTLNEINSLDGWAGFGYIAAEADLKRMGIISN
jgi:tetratricopeptide (TPR) repeat protein